MVNIDKKIQIETLQYITLFILFILAANLFTHFTYNLEKFYVILISSILYVCWGYWHHSYIKKINSLIILEYAFVSVVVVIITGFALGIFRLI